MSSSSSVGYGGRRVLAAWPILSPKKRFAVHDENHSWRTNYGFVKARRHVPSEITRIRRKTAEFLRNVSVLLWILLAKDYRFEDKFLASLIFNSPIRRILNNLRKTCSVQVNKVSIKWLTNSVTSPSRSSTRGKNLKAFAFQACLFNKHTKET